MQQQSQVLTIKMVVPGVELVLHALSKLPYEQSAGLIAEIQGQAQAQIKEAAEAPAEAPAEESVGGTD
jgi:hypothetical protein